MRLQVKIITQRDPLNIRSGAGTGYRIVGTLAKGSTTIVNSQSGDWYKLEDGRGWISKSYTSVMANLETPPPAPSPPPPAPQPQPSPAQAPPPIQTAPPQPKLPDYDKIQSSIADGSNVSQYDVVFGKQNTPSVGTTDSDVLAPMDTTENFKTGVNIYNYFMDYNFVNENLKNVKNNLNIVGDTGYRSISLNLFQKYNRYKIAFPDYHLPKSFSHVFFTRPDLNLVEALGNGNFKLASQVENDPTYYYLFKNNPQLILSLTSDFSYDHDFHLFLSGAANSFELSDEYVKTTEHGETFTGYKVMYGKHNIESKTAGQFSVSYIDDTDLNIYKSHKAWIDYISKVYRGELKSKTDYIRKKILDYACSAYYITCGPDAETILFWSKYYGVFPTNAPSSTLSWGRGNMMKLPEYSINYAYAFKEDFSPLTLAEFNMNSRGSYLYKKIYEPSLASTGKTLTGAPFIETSTDSSGAYIFKLKFRA